MRMIPSFSIHRAGWIFILAFSLGTLVLSSFSSFFGTLGLILTGWCIYFFRDPVRSVPQGDSLVLSPADGIIQSIGVGQMPLELGVKGSFLKISIFLNVFDVHVNRTPMAGKILKSHYHPGQFLNASLDKASDLNERHSYLVEVKSGTEKTKKKNYIAFVQIAGLIARRIVSDVKEGDQLEAGQRIGIIRFGSRTDIYLPEDTAVLVSPGQRMIGGETVLADITIKGSARDAIRI